MKNIYLILFVLSLSICCAQSNNFESFPFVQDVVPPALKLKMERLNESNSNSYGLIAKSNSTIHDNGVVYNGNKYYILIDKTDPEETVDLPQHNVNPDLRFQMPNPIIEKSDVLIVQ